MTRLVKRSGLACVVVLLAIVGLLALLEWHRQRQVASIPMQTVDDLVVAVSAVELEQKYRDSREFVSLCSAVRGRFGAMQARLIRSQHLRKTRVAEIDRQDQPIAIAELLDRIHFEDRKECKTRLEIRQVLGSLIDDAKFRSGLGADALSPFSDDTPDGLYRYDLEGIETVAGQVVVRVHFEPVEQVEGSFNGSVWVEPATAEPVRMRGLASKLPRFVDRLELLMECGPAENGHSQMRRAVMDVMGGFAFYFKHYRLEAELSDYQ